MRGRVGDRRDQFSSESSGNGETLLEQEGVEGEGEGEGEVSDEGEDDGEKASFLRGS